MSVQGGLCNGTLRRNFEPPEGRLFIWPLRSKAAHVSSWHLDMPRQPDDVRSPGAKQTFRRKAAISVFDPIETLAMLPRNNNSVLRAEF